MEDLQKIGMALCSLGVIIITLACILLFDRLLLILGNLSFLIGLVLLIGVAKTGKFFLKKKVPSLAFFGGCGVIVMGWPFAGFCLEIYGLWKLFALFLPNVIQTLKLYVPGISVVLAIPPFSWLNDQIQSQRRLPV